MTSSLASQFNFPSSSVAMKLLSSVIVFIVLPFDQGYLIASISRLSTIDPESTHTWLTGTKAVLATLLAVPATSRSNL